MMHGATPVTVSAATTSATSVPFATATANQVCSSPASSPFFTSGISSDFSVSIRLFIFTLMIPMCLLMKNT